MKRSAMRLLLIVLLAGLACNGLAPGAAPPPVATVAGPGASPTAVATVPAGPTSVAEATATASPSAAPPTMAASATAPPSSPSPTAPPTAVPSPTEPAIEADIAYVQRDPALGTFTVFVTHVVAGQAVETRPYTELEPWRVEITGLAWSPTGDHLAFRTDGAAGQELYIINIAAGGALTLVGPISGAIYEDSPASEGFSWSPDGQHLAWMRQGALWLYSLPSGQSRPLTSGGGDFDWQWMHPAFAASGDAVFVTGDNPDLLEEYGINGPFGLYRVPLDGSWVGRAPGDTSLLSMSGELYGRPWDARIVASPDGQSVILINRIFVDGCAHLTQYLLGSAAGGDARELAIPSLPAPGGPEEEMYLMGDSLAFDPGGDGVWLNGRVKFCGHPADIAAGPQITHLTLDGVEQAIIPGDYTHLSLDPTGTWLGAIKRDPHRPSRVQILGRDGHLVLDLGEGELAAMRP
jgi:hypothetical protein